MNGTHNNSAGRLLLFAHHALECVQGMPVREVLTSFIPVDFPEELKPLISERLAGLLLSLPHEIYIDIVASTGQNEASMFMGWHRPYLKQLNQIQLGGNATTLKGVFSETSLNSISICSYTLQQKYPQEIFDAKLLADALDSINREIDNVLPKNASQTRHFVLARLMEARWSLIDYYLLGPLPVKKFFESEVFKIASNPEPYKVASNDGFGNSMSIMFAKLYSVIKFANHFRKFIQNAEEITGIPLLSATDAGDTPSSEQ